MAREKLTVDSGSATSTQVTTAPAGTKLAFVQVQHAKMVHYEITPAGQTIRAADSSSPTLTGDTLFEFGPQWTISFIESVE